MVEEQGFDAELLGTVAIADCRKREEFRVKTRDGQWETHATLNIVASHTPLAKSRLVLPLARRFARRPQETTTSFQDCWQHEVYLPLGELIGFRFDRVCASTERGHYAMMCNAGQPPIPLSRTEGRLVDLDAPEIQALLSPLPTRNRSTATAEAYRAREALVGPRRWGRLLARFQSGGRGRCAAAPAATTDKRGDAEQPARRLPLPVRPRACRRRPIPRRGNATAYNAGAADTACQRSSARPRHVPRSGPTRSSSTPCSTRPVKADAQYRLAHKAGAHRRLHPQGRAGRAKLAGNQPDLGRGSCGQPRALPARDIRGRHRALRRQELGRLVRVTGSTIMARQVRRTA